MRPVKHVAAIYATKSKHLLRIYVPHEEEDEDVQFNRQHLRSGETLIRVPMEVFQSGNHTVIQDIIGNPSHELAPEDLWDGERFVRNA